MREMKKNFAVGEYEWEVTLKEAEDKDIGYVIPTIHGTNMDMSRDEKETEKEEQTLEI
jgi:hypothetical protein